MRKQSLKIMLTLVCSVGLLIFISVGSVLYVQWSASQKILSELGGRLVVRNLEIIAEGIKGYLDPVCQQVEYLARLFETGLYSTSDADRIDDLLRGSVAASPHIGAVIVLNQNLKAVRIRRDASSNQYQISHPDLSGNKQFNVVLTEARIRKGGYWGRLHYNPEINTTFFNYRRPLYKDDKFIGVIAAAVSVERFSSLVDRLGNLFGNTAFVLYGKDRVLAHPILVSNPQTRTIDEPLVSTKHAGDPILAALNRAVPSDLVNVSERKSAQLFELEVNEEDYFIMRQPLKQYGEQPLVMGIYRKAKEINAPVRLLYMSGVTGIAFLIVSLLVTVWLGHIVSKPIREVTKGVKQIRQFSFGDIKPIATTWIKEVAELARSFNGMLGGLRFFETYVPHALVRRLIDQGYDAHVESEKRELTVMFTDIVSFTSMCEGMNASEVADFINDHLTILAECVEAEGGTIDKYIGDALMAFWGAPEKMENSAIGACRAAKCMVSAIKEDNKRRVAAGKKPIGLRMGIHTGPLVVGNIGAPSRINYTVVGDTVNTTQRLESLGKKVDPDAEVIVLLSATTKSLLPDDFKMKPIGSFHVKGKEAEVEVFRLLE
ncbi:MAG: adenylate/guanylate cyclase domain-containing protein [Planctomycetota bacterium]|jgi:adenylate cyclase